MKRTVYQQGDVVIKKLNIDCLEDKLETKNEWGTIVKSEIKNFSSNTSNSNAVIALGEATGHTHSIDLNNHIEGTQVRFCTMKYKAKTELGLVPDYIEIKGGEATLTHQEHNPINIPVGIYEIGIVREADHINNMVRSVVD
tara:strand:- start:3408 stop:3830 length:423 start_codon:yes stop_codon:yes gene_type:complete